MGFHRCEYCGSETSSGDVRLIFCNGHFYQVPDMLVHYVREHLYRPPQGFIDDVMSGELVEHLNPPHRVAVPERVGYLTGAYTGGDVPHLFLYVLAGMMAIAAKQGSWIQTRGI